MLIHFKGNSSMKFDVVKKWNEDFVSYSSFSHLNNSIETGFLESEMKKENLPLIDAYGDLEAPKPREMIELEVILLLLLLHLFH